MAKDPRFNPEFQKNQQQTRESTNQIQGKEIGNTTILTEHLTSSSVTVDKLADGSVTNAKLANDSVTADKIATGAVSTSEINTGAEPTVSTIYSNSWFRSNGNSGWYNQTYGGGIFMEDSTYVKVYNGKAFMPSAGVGDNGIIFPLNPGGGGGDSASIKYFSTGGEDTILEISANNDVGDRINILATGRVYIRGKTAESSGPATIITATNGSANLSMPSGWSGLATWDISCASISYLYGTQQSDERRKDKITKLTNNLDKLLKIQPVSFIWKEGLDSSGGKVHHGFIAQNIEKIIPELVMETTDGYKTLAQTELLATVFGAIQEQQEIIEKQQKTIESLEARLNLLEDLLK